MAKILSQMTPPLCLSPDALFFWENAGWSYHPTRETPEQGRLIGATRLAAAEALARERLMRFKWLPESDEDRSGIEHDSPLWECVAYLGGTAIESLGNIDMGADADPWTHGVPGGGDAYARVVEAELALAHFRGLIA